MLLEEGNRSSLGFRMEGGARYVAGRPLVRGLEPRFQSNYGFGLDDCLEIQARLCQVPLQYLNRMREETVLLLQANQRWDLTRFIASWPAAESAADVTAGKLTTRALPVQRRNGDVSQPSFQTGGKFQQVVSQQSPSKNICTSSRTSTPGAALRRSLRRSLDGSADCSVCLALLGVPAREDVH